jgi:arylformamidase
MAAMLTFGGIEFNLNVSHHLSIPLQDGPDQLNCYYAPKFRSEAVVMGDFIGDTKKGGPVNYRNVYLNPHGNGTHTECVAHISDIEITIHQALQTVFCLAQVISVPTVTIKNGDRIITAEELTGQLLPNMEAVIFRTLPNSEEKRTLQYSGTNPPYLEPAIGQMLKEAGILHILTDLPSLDREEDGGQLLTHKSFWNVPENPRLNATITELIYVPDEIRDGVYLLNLQIAPFGLDAAPSRPVIFPPVHPI